MITVHKNIKLPCKSNHVSFDAGSIIVCTTTESIYKESITNVKTLTVGKLYRVISQVHIPIVVVRNHLVNVTGDDGIIRAYKREYFSGTDLYVQCYNNYNGSSQLTIGKLYKVGGTHKLSSGRLAYSILNDEGKVLVYTTDTVKELQEKDLASLKDFE